MVLFSFRLKPTKSAPSSLICHCWVSCDLGENHVGTDVETEVHTSNTSDLKHKASEQQASNGQQASSMNNFPPTWKKIIHAQKRSSILFLPCWKKKKVSLSVLHTSTRQMKRRCLQLTPPTFSKWEASFLKSVSVPLKYQVKLMSSIGSCWTWQGKMTLSPTVTSMLEGAKVILVGSVESRSYQLLDSCIAELCLLLIFYHGLQIWLMTVTSNYAAGL